MAVHARDHSGFHWIYLHPHLLARHNECHRSFSDEFQFRAADGSGEWRVGRARALLLPGWVDPADHLCDSGVYGAVSRQPEEGGLDATHAAHHTTTAACTQ